VTIQRDLRCLRQLPLFRDVDPQRLKLLAFASERVHFEPGETVCRQGEPGDAAYVILEGRARVVHEGAEGPVEVATLGPNDVVGEIAILCGVPRTATVVAETPLETLRIDRDTFLATVRQFPEIALGIMRELAVRLHETTRRLGTLVAECGARSERP